MLVLYAEGYASWNNIMTIGSFLIVNFWNDLKEETYCK